MLNQEQLIQDARDSSSPHFLESLGGVGCTLQRGYCRQLLFPKYCPLFADGKYLCLGSSCMGTRKCSLNFPSLTLVPPSNSIPRLSIPKAKVQKKVLYILLNHSYFYLYLQLNAASSIPKQTTSKTLESSRKTSYSPKKVKVDMASVISINILSHF